MLEAFLLATKEQQEDSFLSATPLPVIRPDFTVAAFQQSSQHHAADLCRGYFSDELHLAPLWWIADDKQRILAPRFVAAGESDDEMEDSEEDDDEEEQKEKDKDEEEQGKRRQTAQSQTSPSTRPKGPHIRVSKATPPHSLKTFLAVTAAMIDACFLRDVRPSLCAAPDDDGGNASVLRTQLPDRRRRFLMQLMKEKLMEQLADGREKQSAASSTSLPLLQELFCWDATTGQPHRRRNVVGATTRGAQQHQDPSSAAVLPRAAAAASESVIAAIQDSFTDRFEMPPLSAEEATTFYSDLLCIFGSTHNRLASKEGSAMSSRGWSELSWLLEPFLPCVLTNPLQELLPNVNAAGWFPLTRGSVDGTVERMRWQLLEAFTTSSSDMEEDRCQALARQWLSNICKKIEKRKMGLTSIVGRWRTVASTWGAPNLTTEDKAAEGAAIEDPIEMLPSLSQLLGIDDAHAQAVVRLHCDVLAQDAPWRGGSSSSSNAERFWTVLVLWTLLTNEVEQLVMR